MKKIIIKTLLLICLIIYCFTFFNKYNLEINTNDTVSRDYKNKLIEVSENNKISYSLYNGGLASSYENKYFIEYDAEYINNKKINLQKRGIINSEYFLSNKLKTLKVKIKDRNNKVLYKTPNLVNLDKGLINKNIYPEYMSLYINDKNELVLNIPTYMDADMSEFSKYDKVTDYKFYSNHNKLMYSYNFKTNKMTLNKGAEVVLKSRVINEKDAISYQFDKFYYEVENEDNKLKSNNSIIIYDASSYYLTHKNAEIFKIFPNLKEYLEKHKNVKQLIFTFEDDLSDEEIIKILK